jgi:hypothetical protein
VFSDILQGAGDVLSAPRRGLYALGNMAARGLGYQGPDVNNFSDLLGRAGMEDGTLKSVLGFAGDVATDPLTYAGGALVRGGLGALGAGASGLGRLKGLRGGFAMATADDAGRAAGQILGGGKGLKDLAGMVGGTLPESSAAEGVLGRYLAAGPAGEMLGVAGLPGGAGASLASAGRGVARHETMHGLVDAAVQSGSSRGLGPLARAAAWGKSGGDAGLRAGVGRLMDEAAAHAAESRGALGQARGALSFLLGGRPQDRLGYADWISRASPAVANAYLYAPAAGKLTAGAAAAGGGYLGARSAWDALRGGPE